MRCLAANNPAHRRIMAQPFRIIYIFVSSKTAKHGLPQHSNESVPAILADPCVQKPLICHRGEAERVIEFPVGKQSGVGGDNRTTKLEHQTAVKIEPENLICRFTRRVRRSRFFKTEISY